MTNDPSRLELSPDQMRELGYRAIDMLVDHWVHLADRPAAVDVELATLRGKLREPLPEQPSDWPAALEFARQNVFETMGQIAHPRFLAFVPGPSNFVGAIADALVSGYNTAASLWRETPGPAELELTTLEWLRELCGLDGGSEGLFVSGGSVANLTGIAVAREAKLGEDTHSAIAYCADQTHSSVARGFRILGFRRDQLRAVATDGHFRIDTVALRHAIETDLKDGLRPFCVVGNAGTTNTGAIDPLGALADLAEEYGLWLHVDGAYGGAASLVPRGRALLAGMERADSIVIDPHKWLFQPYEAGVVFVRLPGMLERTFSSHPEYLQDVAAGEHEVNFSERGVQLSRGLRAFKLWLSLKVFGAQAFRAAIDRGIDAAERAQSMLIETGHFEIVTPATIGVVTFRFTRNGFGGEASDRLQRQIVDSLLNDGYAFVTSTELKGRTCLRFCTINPRLTEADLAGTIERIVRFGDQAARH